MPRAGGGVGGSYLPEGEKNHNGIDASSSLNKQVNPV